MKKIGLGIAVLLFALVFDRCSFGLTWLTLGIGVIGLILAIIGYLDK